MYESINVNVLNTKILSTIENKISEYG